jgi:hypothetical protein
MERSWVVDDCGAQPLDVERLAEEAAVPGQTPNAVEGDGRDKKTITLGNGDQASAILGLLDYVHTLRQLRQTDCLDPHPVLIRPK